MTVAGPRVLVCDDEPQILRALKIVLREAGFEASPAAIGRRGARRRGAAPAGRRDPRSGAARRQRRRGVPRAARAGAEMPIIMLSAVGEEDEKVARARGRRRRLRDQAVRAARARRAAARRAAAHGHGAADEPAIARRRPGDRSRRARRPARRARGPSHADRVRLLRTLARQPRAAADPPRAAQRGVGPGLRRRHADAAHPHRQPAPQDRAGAASRATSAPSPGVGYRFIG